IEPMKLSYGRKFDWYYGNLVLSLLTIFVLVILDGYTSTKREVIEVTVLKKYKKKGLEDPASSYFLVFKWPSDRHGLPIQLPEKTHLKVDSSDYHNAIISQSKLHVLYYQGFLGYPRIYKHQFKAQ
ncbi:MAG: hypothetical protein KDD33_06900, partial [Bdellovibrionales bacterium]|nr:hypothetical protein [Bdellovibrionales bacterium]